MRVLGIETSCDETAAAVVDVAAGRARICSNVVHTQAAAHARFGGVVPEVASREHVGRILGVIDDAVAGWGGVAALQGVAVTRGPGLLGSLLVGLQAGKGLALARDVPWIGVNHLEGHLAAAFLADAPPTYPHVALVVSGGHTHLYEARGLGRYRALGQTLDDAAGEAFDKVAKILGLGYPGGVAIEAHARDGDPHAFDLPRPMRRSGCLNMSFSGLKTAARTVLQAQARPMEGQVLADFCASVQEAIVDVLSQRAVAAARACAAPGIVLAGGVAANGRLRTRLAERAAAAGLWLFVPPKPLCTDNAAMVAAAGGMRLALGERSPWATMASSRWPLQTMAPPPGGVPPPAWPAPQAPGAAPCP